MASGIYKIIDLKDRCYVGSTKSLSFRRNMHFKDLSGGRHHNSRLQNYFNKYGENSLKFEIIENCEVEELVNREQYYIDTLNPFFNILRFAYSSLGQPSWIKGKKMADEHKAKIIAKQIGRKMTEETKEKIRQKAIGRKGYWEGKKLSLETCLKISEARKNVKLSDNHKSKLTFKGLNHSDEWKKIRSEAQKGRKLSDETRKKIGEAHKGKKLSEEHRAKVILTLIHNKKIA